MKQLIHIFISLTIGLFACNSATDRQDKNVENAVTTDSITVTGFQSTETNMKQEQNNDCVRGQAEPIIEKTDYPNTTFVLQPDSLTAFETVVFDNGDKLIIHNWGCENYVLTFRFETSRFQQDSTNLEYWFRSAHRLMTEMLGGLHSPIDIKSGITHLEWYIDRDRKNKYENLRFGEEIDFGGKGTRDFVTVDRIEKITDKKFAIEISFATGPL